MGEVLAGSNAAWEFDSDAVVIRYGRAIRAAKLLQVLGERRVPYEALAGVELAPGRRGTVVLRALPRPGADPLMDAADGQLREAADPYRIVLPAEREPLAETYADKLCAAIGYDAEDGPATRYLVDAPAPPLSFKAYDATASFDGGTVAFRWFRTGASTAKWKVGDQRFPVTDLSGVEWRSPERVGGCLRLLRRADDEAATRPERHPEDDPAAVVFGLGYGPVHESLPLAAAVLAAVQRAGKKQLSAD
jgi:hypothetical protein